MNVFNNSKIFSIFINHYQLLVKFFNRFQIFFKQLLKQANVNKSLYEINKNRNFHEQILRLLLLVTMSRFINSNRKYSIDFIIFSSTSRTRQRTSEKLASIRATFRPCVRPLNSQKSNLFVCLDTKVKRTVVYRKNKPNIFV